jgi:hypothetical protein
MTSLLANLRSKPSGKASVLLTQAIEKHGVGGLFSTCRFHLWCNLDGKRSLNPY